MIGTAINYMDASQVTNFIINDRIAQPNLHQDDPFYFISVTSVDGLHGNDIAFETHPRPHQHGEVSGDVFRRGGTITLSGKILALNLALLEQAADFLVLMFSEVENPRNMIWTRFDGTQVYLSLRPTEDVQITESFKSGKYEWDWSVGLRAQSLTTRLYPEGTPYPDWQDDTF